MCASQLGDLRHAYTIFIGETRATLSVHAGGVEFDLPRKLALPTSYLTGLDRVAAKALNKCQVSLAYYDMFGNKNTMEFLMHEDDFKALKRDLGK